MEKGRIVFAISFLAPYRGKILNKIAMFNYFATLTQTAYFLRPFDLKKKNAVAQWKRVRLNFRSHLWNRGEILNQMAMFKYFSILKLKLCIFQDHLKKTL